MKRSWSEDLAFELCSHPSGERRRQQARQVNGDAELDEFLNELLRPPGGLRHAMQHGAMGPSVSRSVGNMASPASASHRASPAHIMVSVPQPATQPVPTSVSRSVGNMASQAGASHRATPDHMDSVPQPAAEPVPTRVSRSVGNMATSLAGASHQAGPAHVVSVAELVPKRSKTCQRQAPNQTLAEPHEFDIVLQRCSTHDDVMHASVYSQAHSATDKPPIEAIRSYIRALLDEIGVAIFKIGITGCGVHRFHNECFGYKHDGWNNLHILYGGSPAQCAGLEEVLTDSFKYMSGHHKCCNILRGGEKCSQKRDPASSML